MPEDGVISYFIMMSKSVLYIYPSICISIYSIHISNCLLHYGRSYVRGWSYQLLYYDKKSFLYVYLSIYRYICPSICISVHLSVYLSTYQSFYLSIQPINLSIYLIWKLIISNQLLYLI